MIYLAFVSLGLPDTLLGSAWPVMRGEAVSVWLPASQQAYRRAEELLPEVLPTDAWERLRMLTEDRRTPHLYWALNDLSIIGKNHIPDCDLRLWPEMYSLTLELMRMYEKPDYDGSQKQRLGILLLRTLWEQAGSGQATDEEKRMLAYTLVNSYRDDDEGYDIPLTTYTSKRYDHKKKMKDMRKSRLLPDCPAGACSNG